MGPPSASGFGGYCFGFASDADYLVLADGDHALKSSLQKDISPLFLPVPRDPDLDAPSRFAVEGFATVVRLPLRNAAAREAARRESLRRGRRLPGFRSVGTPKYDWPAAWCSFDGRDH